MDRVAATRYRRMIEQAAESLSDADATSVPDLFPNWEPDTDYVVDDRRKYNEILWKCIQAHKSQDDWTPDVAVSLWTRTSAEEWPEWNQPAGSHDAYRIGAKVSHNGKHWVNEVDYNTYEPGVYGWTTVT